MFAMPRFKLLSSVNPKGAIEVDYNRKMTHYSRNLLADICHRLN